MSTIAPTWNYDLIVIGGGSGGVRAARMAAARGVKVAMVESGAMGGTCVNVGCIPKKLYSYAAGYAEAFAEARGYGWQMPEHIALDWSALKAARATEIADDLTAKFGPRFTTPQLLRDMAAKGDSFYGRFGAGKKAA